MKKYKLFFAILIIILLSGCGTSSNQTTSMEQLHHDVKDTLATASYENMEILIDDIMFLSEQEELAIVTLSRYKIEEDYSKSELVKFYVENVFCDLLNIDHIDTSLVVDVGSKITDENWNTSYSKYYADVLNTIEEYDEIPTLAYKNYDEYSQMSYSRNWISGVYISQGGLGRLTNNPGPFGVLDTLSGAELKSYDCRIDDLSDTYQLLDGMTTVAAAKEAIESYFNEHYPITGKSNGIENKVVKLTAVQIPGTEYNAFTFERTFSYKGIPLRYGTEYEGNEFICMAEGIMCDRNTVDVTVGIINNYNEPKINSYIEQYIPFSEILDRVAYYLTNETRFQLIYGGLEYRAESLTDEEGFLMKPYWCFLLDNPNDDTRIKLYVDMENGEITGRYETMTK